MAYNCQKTIYLPYVNAFAYKVEKMLQQPCPMWVIFALFFSVLVWYTLPTGISWLNFTPPARQKIQYHFLTLPDIIVNLSRNDTQQQFLKLSLVFMVSSEKNKAQVTHCMPKIIHSFHLYLRDLYAKDLKGSQGLLRLKEALLMRANTHIAPEKIHDLLFREIIVQ